MNAAPEIGWWRRRLDRGAEPGSIEGPVDCSSVASVLQRYLDGELAGDLDAVHAHLEACRDCGLEAATYQRIKAALSRPTSQPIEPAVLERLRAFGADLG